VTIAGDEFSHFVEAQDRCLSDVIAELSAGRKRSHWMWFIFPQMSGLGSSSFAVRFGLEGLDQAARYLSHPVLGPRLRQAAELMLRQAGQDPIDVLGAIDALKLRSSMTLFSRVPGAPQEFRDVLDRFYDGAECDRTLRLLGLNS